MNKYAQIAINVVKRINLDNSINPKEAWEIEANNLFGEGKASAKKGCPKNAFLGLCEEGLIKGIPKGEYITRSDNLNKEYVLEAYKYLKNNNSNITPLELWRKIGMDKKSHNSQMNILCELFKLGLINI